MTQEQVYELVGRYMNGETTLAEERRLYEYFREKKDLPQSLHTYREMMRQMEWRRAMKLGQRPFRVRNRALSAGGAMLPFWWALLCSAVSPMRLSAIICFPDSGIQRMPP